MKKINIIEFLKRVSVVTWDSPKECIIHIFGQGEKRNIVSTLDAILQRKILGVSI